MSPASICSAYLCTTCDDHILIINFGFAFLIKLKEFFAANKSVSFGKTLIISLTNSMKWSLNAVNMEESWLITYNIEWSSFYILFRNLFSQHHFQIFISKRIQTNQPIPDTVPNNILPIFLLKELYLKRLLFFDTNEQAKLFDTLFYYLESFFF